MSLSKWVMAIPVAITVLAMLLDLLLSLFLSKDEESAREAKMFVWWICLVVVVLLLVQTWLVLRVAPERCN